MTKFLVVVALLSGCSIALQAKPSRGVAGKSCSTSNAYWIADVVGIAAGVAGMIYSVAKRGEPEAIVGAPAAIGSVLYLASAGNGIRWRRECEAGTPSHLAAR